MRGSDVYLSVCGVPLMVKGNPKLTDIKVRLHAVAYPPCRTAGEAGWFEWSVVEAWLDDELLDERITKGINGWCHGYRRRECEEALLQEQMAIAS